MFHFFEVMDKMPPMYFVWALYLFLGGVGFILARINPLLLTLLTPIYILAVITSVLIFSELNSPYVGPQIIQEAGYGYLVHHYLAIFVGVLLQSAGIVVWFIKKDNKPLR